MYYLQSRYYDPTTGRFLNADAFASTGQGLLGNNMFAYCNNNPINVSDNTGHWPAPIKLNAEDIEELFETVEGFLLGAVIRFASSHDLNRRPNRGDPGSVFTAPNGDKRGFGADGLPEWDYDHDDHGEKINHVTKTAATITTGIGQRRSLEAMPTQ